MSTQEQERIVSAYLQAAGSQEGDRYAVKGEELSWLISYAAQLNAAKLRTLTALQHAIPQAGGLQELKETLTNVIIMQTRLKDREEALAKALSNAARSGAIKQVSTDATDIREMIKGSVEASQHVQQKASKK